MTILVQVCVEVVGTTFVGVVGQVEDVQRVALARVGVAVRIDLSDIDLTCIVVGQLVEVALDVVGGQRGGSTGEEGVDVVPCQSCTVITIFHIVGQLTIFQMGWGGGEHPLLGVAHAMGFLGVFEIIQIGGIALGVLRRSCLELGIFTREGDAGGGIEVEEGQLVQHVGQPLRVLFPVHMEAPQHVVQWFFVHPHFRGEGFLGHFHERTTDVEVLGEVIIPVHTQHRLAHEGEGVMVFQADTDIGACIDNALVDDPDNTGGVVHTIVGAFHQGHTTCRHHHRTRGGTRTDIDFTAVGGLVFTCQREFVLLCYLLGDSLGGVIELVVAVLVGQVFITEFLAQPVTERLCNGEDDMTCLGDDGIAFDEVEPAVRIGLLVVIQSVEVEHLQQGGLLEGLFRDIAEFHTCRVTQVFDVQLELLFLHGHGLEIIDVLHHQVPVGDAGRTGGVLQQFHEQGLVVVFLVG